MNESRRGNDLEKENQGNKKNIIYVIVRSAEDIGNSLSDVLVFAMSIK